MAWRNIRRAGGSKYGSKKTEVDGILFDSKKEARRYQQLLLLQQAGEITGLMRQVKFVLIPAQYGPDTIGPRGGHKRGPLLERECSYYADFVYQQVLPFGDPEEYPTVVEDTKGFKTADYLIKRKLMLHKYGIKVQEV